MEGDFRHVNDAALSASMVFYSELKFGAPGKIIYQTTGEVEPRAHENQAASCVYHQPINPNMI